LKTVLVFAAHPDDELLGCAGTIARHAGNGDAVHVIIMAEGATSRGAVRSRADHLEELERLRQAANEAGAILGVRSVDVLDFPDNRMDSCDLLDVTKSTERVISDRDPHIVYTHHVGDVNVDHRITHQAVYTACRPLPGSRLERILTFETVSSTEWMPAGSGSAFLPNWFVDISGTIERKMQALSVYRSEMRAWPHPRSARALDHLARWRGSSIGVEAAEAFILLRMIERG
jgi:LmbE family N-acetylglucosaminyl deacetylase